MSNKVSSASIEVLNQFDKLTDVHVFILDCTISNRSGTKADTKKGQEFWRVEKKENARTVGSMYEVRVGPVVPYRDIAKGLELPYLHPKNAPPWGQLSDSLETRNYSGKRFSAPFVILRRTSRPGDKHRAVATLVTGKKEFAVENHLLVLQPLDKKLISCKALVLSLRDPRTTIWLDRNLRCRHLTVNIVRKIPVW